MRVNQANVKILDSLKTNRERLEFMTGGVVAVGRTGQVIDNKRLVTRYVTKIRGIPVGKEDTWLHETEREARQHGRRIMNIWEEELAELKETYGDED